MRVEGKRYRDQWLPNYYPSREVSEGQWLRISRTGKTVALAKAEDEQLNEVFMDEKLFLKLEETGHIITPANAERIFKDLQLWQEPVYAGPFLHIVVLTKRCNLDCIYCHMNPEPVQALQSTYDLSKETIREIVRFALESPNPRLGFEFQGGEPFLNFSALQFFVEQARQGNRQVGKDLSFSVVTNLMVATDDQLRYCRDEGIRVSYTLNGPEAMHDYYRVTRIGTGSYLRVRTRLEQVQQMFPGLVTSTPLCVVDAENAGRLKEMIDYYYDAGFDGLSIVRLKHMGNARRNRLDLDIRRFLTHYVEALNYILEKNRNSNRHFRERMVPVVLSKILGDSDVTFVDWRNPCGDVSGAITYDYDGEILPADEARSMRGEFGLGNVKGLKYRDFVDQKESFRTMNLSLRDRDPECRECAYNPFCGVTPVVEFARTGSAVPRPYESDECLFTLTILDWAFQKLLTDPIPLVRMLPHAGEMFEQILASQPNSSPEVNNCA